ncbi:Sodium- and chloride-dependent neutral and basic amino acid transporter B(0+) [Toxocara canis]|uniref:Sodium-and chloride-dependent neutral and basic amino acid transporter B(0+) n=1 Tax=Toxocara canis TaxID=6265 RepID=A0A0B2V791_TOXCA|nr:Sodium- and chloride-dependent neutral and basic amino acid transporter B(0+) [Toxocara canis]
MSSVVFFNALVVAISMLGMRTYVKIAKFIVVCPMSVIILLTVMIFYKFGFRDSMLSIRSTLEPNFRKLMAIRAWTDAVLHVMPSLGVANGIFIVISSMKKFDNNAIRDTVFVVVVDILCSIFSCFLISPIIGYTASQMYAMTDKTVFGHKMRYLIGDWSQLPYTYMPSAFGHTSAELGLLSALYIAVFVMSLGPQVVALEMIVLTVYRTFPGLLQMDERISRKFICSAYLAAMFAYCYVANDEKTSGHFLETYYVLIPLPFLAILEIAVMVHLYRMPRFIVNMKTMLGKPPSKLWRFFGYPVGWYWTATLYVITPVTCCVTGVLLFFDGRIGETLTRANLFRAATAVLITPSIVVATLIYKVITTVKVGQSFRNLFVTDFKWGPKRLMDRQRAIHEEHAARIYT